MPEFEKDEFKFPDEVALSQEPEEGHIEIEVEDDLPAEDRGKTPMPKPLVEELEADDLDKYDEAVKIKLKQMRKVWHDERREKEAALREQQEAVTFAQRILEENKRMKAVLQYGEKAYADTAQNAATLELEAAKKEYKNAYEEADSDRLVAAQEALHLAQLKLINAKNFKVSSLQDEESVVQQPQQYSQQQQPQVPQPDRRALAWQERNTWFGQDEEMTATALGLHEKLRRNGVVIGSDDYYAALDKTMRKRFPENFEESKPEDKQRAKPATVVAPATRSTSSNKIKLKASQVQLAKKLGLTPEQYAMAALKLETQNG